MGQVIHKIKMSWKHATREEILHQLHEDQKIFKERFDGNPENFDRCSTHEGDVFLRHLKKRVEYLNEVYKSHVKHHNATSKIINHKYGVHEPMSVDTHIGLFATNQISYYHGMIKDIQLHRRYRKHFPARVAKPAGPIKKAAVKVLHKTAPKHSPPKQLHKKSPPRKEPLHSHAPVHVASHAPSHAPSHGAKVKPLKFNLTHFFKK